MSKLKIVKILRWMITEAPGGIPQCYVQKGGTEKKYLRLPALCNLFLEAKLQSLMVQTYVSTKNSKRNSSQIEFLHLKLLSFSKGKSKKEK